MDGTTTRSRAGILYAEDFDELPAPPPRPEPPTPGYTQAALDDAVSAACAEAVHAARMDWQACALQAQSDALVAIARNLTAAEAAAAAVATETAEGTVRTIMAILVGLLPALCARHGHAELRAMLRHLLPTLAQQPRVTVRLSPAVLDGVRADLAEMDEDLAATIVLTPATLPPGDTRVIWTNGKLVRDTAALRNAVIAALVELGLLEPTLERSLAVAE